MHGGNAQEAGMCGILGGMSMQESKKFAFPSYPFDAQALTDWAMDEYHYAADPKLIYKIASEGGKSLDWMADCGVQWPRCRCTWRRRTRRLTITCSR